MALSGGGRGWYSSTPTPALHGLTISNGKAFFTSRRRNTMQRRANGISVRWKKSATHVRSGHECSGSRLKSYPAAARLRGLTIHELTLKTVDEVLSVFSDFMLLSGQAFAAESMPKSSPRLSFLHKVGLGYLTLNRQTQAFWWRVFNGCA